MSRPCHGSWDESLPKAVMWKTFPHRLFFARSHSVTWGMGGVAFLHPENNTNEKVHMCLYRITYVIFACFFFPSVHVVEAVFLSLNHISIFLDFHLFSNCVGLSSSMISYFKRTLLFNTGILLYLIYLVYNLFLKTSPKFWRNLRYYFP